MSAPEHPYPTHELSHEDQRVVGWRFDQFRQLGTQPPGTDLIHWTGARVSDAVRLGEGHEDRDGWLAFRQQKTGGQTSQRLGLTPP